MATTTKVALTEGTNIEEQFLSMAPIRTLKLTSTDIFDERWDTSMQLDLLEKTVLSPIAKKYPPSLAYRKLFLKTLLKKFECSGIDICDKLYEEFTNLMTLSDTGIDNCYRTYTLPNKQMLTTKESTKVISHGTTGLQTWPAALCLAEWAMVNNTLLDEKSIVELGCGLGLTGLIISQTCTPKQYVFTDCHQQVLKTLQENIDININQRDRVRDYDSLSTKNSCRTSTRDCGLDTEVKNCCLENSITSGQSGVGDKHRQLTPCERYSYNPYKASHTCEDQLGGNSEDGTSRSEIKLDCHISMETLDWESVDDSVLRDLKADVVLAADIVYDTSIVSPLVNVLHRLLSNQGQEDKCPPVAYIASTIRNKDTYQCFLKALDEHHINHTDVAIPSPSVFYYDKSCPIKLLHLSL